MKTLKIILFSLLICGIVACDNTKTASSNKIEDSVVHPQEKDSLKHVGDLLFANDTIAIYKLKDSIAFFAAKAKAVSHQDTLSYIEDFTLAKKLLRDKITFGDWNSDKRIIDSNMNGQMVAKIKFDNKNDFDPNENQSTYYDIGFVRYYPTEEIVLFEGGHSTDYSIELRNGIMDEWVGNPAYIVFSPTKKYRINGSFGGQECSSYFIQKNIDNQFTFWTEIPMDLTKEQFDLCTIKDIFWKSDTELYFRNFFYGQTNDPRAGFFRIVIKR